MTASRTSLLAPLLSLGLVGFAVTGFSPNAAADQDAPYCETLSAALPGIDATYNELKKTADAEAAAADAPAEDEDDEDAQEATAASPAKPQVELDAGSLLQKEVELADRLAGLLNDLAHQTQEAGLKRIAKEASDTAGTFAGSLHARQDGDAPDALPRSNSSGGVPDAADATNVGMLGGLLHPTQPGDAGDAWSADFNFNSNKLRNEMNALNHLCQATDLSQPDGSVTAGSRRAGG